MDSGATVLQWLARAFTERPRFQSTTAGISSATVTTAQAGSIRSAAARVKPYPCRLPAPGAAAVFNRAQPSSASASSEPCTRLFINSPRMPDGRMENSLSRRAGVSVPPLLGISTAASFIHLFMLSQPGRNARRTFSNNITDRNVAI